MFDQIHILLMKLQFREKLQHAGIPLDPANWTTDQANTAGLIFAMFQGEIRALGTITMNYLLEK